MEKNVVMLNEILTDEEVCVMAEYLEAQKTSRCYGGYEVLPKLEIIEDFMNEVLFINEFNGEYADEYKSRMDYVERGGFEKDYFASWLENYSDYPTLKEIMAFALEVDTAICMWLWAIDNGWIDSEEHWGQES